MSTSTPNKTPAPETHWLNEQFIRKYSTKLLGYCRYLTNGDLNEAEDLVQMTWLSLLSGNVEPSSPNPLPMLKRCVFHIYLKQRERQRRLPTAPLTPDNDPGRTMVEFSDEWLRARIAKLPADEARVVRTLLANPNWTLEDIATALGLSHDRVKKLSARAAKRLEADTDSIP